MTLKPYEENVTKKNLRKFAYQKEIKTLLRVQTYDHYHHYYFEKKNQVKKIREKKTQRKCEK